MVETVNARCKEIQKDWEIEITDLHVKNQVL